MSTRPKLLDLKNGDGACVAIDEADLHLLRGHKPYLGGNGYAYISSNQTGPLLIHRLICPTAPGEHVDHIDGDRLNNCRHNLRPVSPQVNQVNRKRLNRNNSSGVRGVAPTRVSAKNPWRAQITVNRKNIHLGLFPTRDAAIEARRDAERRYFPEMCP